MLAIALTPGAGGGASGASGASAAARVAGAGAWLRPALAQSVSQCSARTLCPDPAIGLLETETEIETRKPGSHRNIYITLTHHSAVDL